MAKKHKKQTNTKKCAICPIESTIICTNCNKVAYCTKEHQKQDWKTHKNDCKSFEITHNDIFGRHLVAARDIKQGEIILKESPIVVGPSITSPPLCLKCYKPIAPYKKQIFCLKCGVAPLCSVTCNSTGHSSKECEIFKQNITSQSLIQHYQIITPFRCLLLREINQEIWKEFLKMEAHMDARRNTPIWRNHKINVEEILKDFNILTEKDIEEELIQKICGILDVNTFELRIPGFEMNPNFGPVDCLRGVFLKAALMAHDCNGNTHLAVDDHFNMTIHASVPISKGAPIYFNYTNALHGTYDRQEHLREGKYFNCSCKRCFDPTECGTNMSSLICVKCKTNFINPIKNNVDIYKHNQFWKCSDKNCGYKYHGSMISSTINCTKDLIEHSDKTDFRSVEKLIKKLSHTFAPNHSIMIDLKQNLVGLYSEFLRREINPNSKILQKKLELCEELIPVLEKIEPGISRLSGITLYEMHIPIVILANKKYDNNEISAEELLKNVLRAEEVLKKAISYLLYEPTASPEGRLANNAMNELKLLRKSISNIEQIVANKTKKKENIDKRRKKKK